jgi:hypothetical protein
MEKLENFFRKFKIIEVLRNISSAREALDIINHYPLYRDIRTIEDLGIKFISKSKKLISYSLPIL